MPNQDEVDACSEITEQKVVVFRNIWDRLATILQWKLLDFSNHVEVDESDTEGVAEQTDQEIVSEVKSMNEQDDPET